MKKLFTLGLLIASLSCLANPVEPELLEVVHSYSGSSSLSVSIKMDKDNRVFAKTLICEETKELTAAESERTRVEVYNGIITKLMLNQAIVAKEMSLKALRPSGFWSSLKMIYKLSESEQIKTVTVDKPILLVNGMWSYGLREVMTLANEASKDQCAGK